MNDRRTSLHRNCLIRGVLPWLIMIIAVTVICFSTIAFGQPFAKLELVTETDQAVGNIAFAENDDLIVSFHPLFKPDIRVARLDSKTGAYTPFPNKPWNTPRKENDWYFDDVLGLRSGAEGVVWVLDMGTRNDITPKLVAWDTKADKLQQIIHLPAPATIASSQPNDFVIDNERQLIVIADEGIARGGDGSKGALIVVDTSTGKSRRILQGHTSTKADASHPIVLDGKTMKADGNPVFVGADGITLDAPGEWLYFCPLNGESVYRIPMKDVADASLTDEQLGKLVERFSHKPNNGGMTIDTSGNLYFTNVEGRSIGFVSAADRKYSVLATDDRMLWPDGISTGADGFMYVSAAQVHRGAPFNDGKSQAQAPYYIFRFKPVAEGIFGR